ncbi:putative type III polyketide synthase [Flavihumibacter petaseus NBRC 106054]|uniref:Putative type III polyketide synthase n=2 Tax=Flavihumibacter TaxID=1004301 RepID=A0A0E9N592_9BACT|nr:putative type III polyketide synthase [Flavihumibacter petaseus NBRC 106054]
MDIRHFMEGVFALDPVERRKLAYLYQHSGIDNRYSVIPDYSLPPAAWQFYSPEESLEPFPDISKRMDWYKRYAAGLSVAAINNCLQDQCLRQECVTHLITVSCTGMSAPGLDVELVELLGFPRSTKRSSINFMGCYAAIHALRQGDQICRAERDARVLIVCTELCTLHFQKTPSPDNIAASLLFGDGSAAVLLGNGEGGLATIRDFYAEFLPSGKKDMCWEITPYGFAMTLSGYIPELIRADFRPLVDRALENAGWVAAQVDDWCIHPGGKRILQAVAHCLDLPDAQLEDAYGVLREFGNMSSPTVLFVLSRMLAKGTGGKTLMAAFGPGLCIETCCLEAVVS